MDSETKEEFAAVRAEIREMKAALRQEIREEAVATRRHFDGVAESVRDDIRIIADAQFAVTDVYSSNQPIYL